MNEAMQGNLLLEIDVPGSETDTGFVSGGNAAEGPSRAPAIGSHSWQVPSPAPDLIPVVLRDATDRGLVVGGVRCSAAELTVEGKQVVVR
jgi:hypothetical protein